MTYSPVYSQDFINYTSDTPNEVFYVPAGFTAVVRYVSSFQDIGSYNLNVYKGNALGAPGITFCTFTDVGISEAANWSGRVVVPEGGYIAIAPSSFGSSPQFYVGGYLLRNVVS